MFTSHTSPRNRAINFLHKIKIAPIHNHFYTINFPHHPAVSHGTQRPPSAPLCPAPLPPPRSACSSSATCAARGNLVLFCRTAIKRRQFPLLRSLPMADDSDDEDAPRGLTIIRKIIGASPSPSPRPPSVVSIQQQQPQSTSSLTLPSTHVRGRLSSPGRHSEVDEVHVSPRPSRRSSPHVSRDAPPPMVCRKCF